MHRDQIGKTNENLTAHLFIPGQWILLRETTVTETQKTWRIETEQRSLYVLIGFTYLHSFNTLSWIGSFVIKTEYCRNVHQPG